MSEKCETPKPNSSGMKAFGAVTVVVAVIAGVYAMTEPMGQRLDFLQAELPSVRAAMALDDAREIGDTERRGALVEKFTEVETQFKGMERRLVSVEEWRIWWNRLQIMTLAGGNATQDEKIAHLEQWIAEHLESE